MNLRLLQKVTDRLVSHSSEFIPVAPYEITIENEELTAYKNSDFNLKIRISGEEIPNSLSIIYSDQRFLMKKKQKRTHFSTP